MWANPVVSSHHADAGAAVEARGQLLDATVVEMTGREPLVLREHLGEVAARAQSHREDALDDVVFDHLNAPKPEMFACFGGSSYGTAVPVEPGLCATIELTVAESDTAASLRSGDVPMLGTPRVVALVEEASVAAIAGRLAPHVTSVGMRVQLDHLIPVPVGVTVRAEATLERVEGRRLSFTVSVNNDRGLVAAGKLTRVLVNRERFLEKAQ